VSTRCPERLRALIAGGLCAGSLCCILTAGLWPFSHPPNDVTWLANQHAVHLGKRATILSSGPLPAVAAACTVEMWLRPRLNDASSTVLAFSGWNGTDRLSVHQSWTDLRIDNEAAHRTTQIYFGDIFQASKTIFLTIVIGPQGTDVFRDGVLVRRVPAQKFQSSPYACSGNFVVGDSLTDNNTWEGDLRGLAIYRYSLTPEQVMMSFTSWMMYGLPDKNSTGKPDALYLFDENAGSTIHDHGSSGVNLSIPERYLIVQQTLLDTPWDAFEATWDYVQDIVINIGGFIPFGFTLGAFLLASGRVSRVTAVVVFAGFLVSLTIETLQAFLPTRDSDLTDVLTNTLGTWLGVMLYQTWLPSWLRIFFWMRTTR
jgi:hypothetical protein